jgi:hypothetical protein
VPRTCNRSHSRPQRCFSDTSGAVSRSNAGPALIQINPGALKRHPFLPIRSSEWLPIGYDRGNAAWVNVDSERQPADTAADRSNSLAVANDAKLPLDARDLYQRAGDHLHLALGWKFPMPREAMRAKATGIEPAAYTTSSQGYPCHR